jgi:hypothetical protein
MKGTTTGVKKMLQSLDIPIQKLGGAPSTVGMNRGKSSLVTNDMKNATNSDLIIRQ